MENKFLKYLLNLHHQMPYGLRQRYLPIIKALRNVRSVVLPLHFFEGEEPTSGERLKIAFLGWDGRIENYWLKKLFTSQKQIGKSTPIPLWKTENYLKHNIHNVDLVIIETNSIARKFMPSDSGFLLPRWLEMKMDIEKSLKIMSRREFQRLIRKYHLTFEKRYSEADFRLFYERMYLPYISVRHKDAAVLADYNQFLNNIFRKKGSQLYFVMKDGEPVAGSIDETKEDSVRMSGIGILDGNEDIKRMGVITASYFFQALEYHQRNIKFVNIGGTSPILTDGLTVYKYSLGAQLFETVRKCENYLRLIPLTRSVAIRSMLRANPFISINDNQYQRNIFIDPGMEEARMKLQHTMKETSFDNIKKTNIFCFNNEELVMEWIRTEGYQGVNVSNY
jgi:hypothetical protein